MIAESPVVDAVVHPYNLGASNRDSRARAQLDTVYAAHELSTDEANARYRLTREEFFTDFSFETMADSLFVESPVDLAVIHALPNLGFAKDYVTDPRRGVGAQPVDAGPGQAAPVRRARSQLRA